MEINVETAGPEHAQSIVLVHGAGGSAATWTMQIRGLARQFLVHAVELNGHGDSKDRAEADTEQAYLNDIDSVVSQLHKPILGGHSMGGALTQLYALKKPNNIQGIILIGTGARLRVSPVIFDMLTNDFEGYIEALGELMFHEDTDHRIVDVSRAEAAKCNPEVIKRDFAFCDGFDIMQEVGNVALPTLIVVGESDLMTPVNYSEYLARMIEHSTLKVIERAGHGVMLERAEEVNNTISEWVMGLISRD